MVLDILGTILGLLYLYLEIKENNWMWVVGSIMPAIYIVVLYRAGIYGDCAMEVYYLLAGIYGLLCWLRGTRSTRSISITRTSARRALCLSAIAFVLWGTFAFVLSRYTNSSVPVLDAFSTALSIVGLWMLSRKLLEQWWVWLVVDAVSTGLYIYKGVYGRATLYAIYTAMAVYGYFAWKRRLCRNQPLS